MKRLGIFLTWIVLVTACSTQNREAAPDIDESNLFAMYSDIQAHVSDTVVSSFSGASLSQGKNAILYHARGTNERPAVSILSMGDMSVFNSNWPVGTHSLDIGLRGIDVIFLDVVNDNGQRFFSLMMRMEIDGESQPRYFAGSSGANEYSFDDNSFQTVIQIANGQRLILESDDLSEKYSEELASSIKLNVYFDTGNGNSEYLGQISTMAGFGNR